MPDEESLVRQAQAGDGDAFGALYEEYFDKVYRYIALRVGDRMEAEDLTEQVFLKALQSISSFRWRGVPFASWLFRIARNQVIDHFRVRAKRETLPLDELVTIAEVDIESTVELNLSIEELVAAVGRLTEAQRQVVSLRFGGGLSLAETARVMGKNLGAVKALQHDALRALRRALSGKIER